MKFRTRVAAAAVALPMILGIAACGGNDKSAGEPNGGLPTPLTTKTTTTAPLKAAPPMRLSNATFAPALNTATTKATSFRITGQMTMQGQSMTMKAASTVKPFAMTMDMTGAALNGTMKMIMVKGVLYLSAPGLTPAGKYAKLDLKKDKDPQIRAIGQMLGSADPMKQFKNWKPGGYTVKFVKSEKLGTLAVDHYKVSVNTAVAMGLVGQKVPAGMPKTIVYDMWLGADKLPYKMSFSMAGMDMVMTISDYNTVAPIVAPPASKIVKQR